MIGVRCLARAAVVAVAAVLLVAPRPAGADIVNGTFDHPSDPLFGWTQDGPGIEVVDGAAHLGITQSMARISQTVVLGEGETTLQFDAKGSRTYCIYWDTGISVSWWGGGGAGSIEPDGDWRHYDLPLVDEHGNPLPAGTSIEIDAEAFCRLIGPEGGGARADLYLDNVTVPEPATLSLLALGGLVALRRRR